MNLGTDVVSLDNALYLTFTGVGQLFSNRIFDIVRFKIGAPTELFDKNFSQSLRGVLFSWDCVRLIKGLFREILGKKCNFLSNIINILNSIADFFPQ